MTVLAAHFLHLGLIGLLGLFSVEDKHIYLKLWPVTVENFCGNLMK